MGEPDPLPVRHDDVARAGVVAQRFCGGLDEPGRVAREQRLLDAGDRRHALRHGQGALFVLPVELLARLPDDQRGAGNDGQQEHADLVDQQLIRERYARLHGSQWIVAVPGPCGAPGTSAGSPAAMPDRERESAGLPRAGRHSGRLQPRVSSPMAPGCLERARWPFPRPAGDRGSGGAPNPKLASMVRPHSRESAVAPPQSSGAVTSTPRCRAWPDAAAPPARSTVETVETTRMCAVPVWVRLSSAPARVAALARSRRRSRAVHGWPRDEVAHRAHRPQPLQSGLASGTCPEGSGRPVAAPRSILLAGVRSPP